MKREANEYDGKDTESERIRGSRRRFSLLNLKTFSSLKNPVYRFYFLGNLGQWGSQNMQMVTRSLLIYRLTGSAALLGLVGLAMALPMLALSLFGGAVADRMQKKRVLQVGQAAAAVNALGVAVALTTGYLSSENAGSWWILIVNSVLQGTIFALMMPSRQAIIPEIVDAEQVMNAISLNALGMNTLRMLAPALAGFLIDAFGFKAIFYSMTGLYIMAMIFTSFIPITKTLPVRAGNTLSDIVEGLKYVRRKTTILFIIGFAMTVIILSMPYQMMMPIFADDILKVGATGMGLLLSVSGVGAMVGSLTFASLSNRKRGGMLLASGLILGVALAVFAFSHSMPLSMGLMVLVGLGQSGRMTLGTTLLQSYADAEYLGRVMSINMIDMGLSQLATFFTGLLAESIGVQWAIGGFAIVLAFLSILTLTFVPRLRKLD